MGVHVRHYDSLPETASTFYLAIDAETTIISRVWASAGEGVVKVTYSDDDHLSDRTPVEHVRKMGWRPLRHLIDKSRSPDFYDWTCRTHERVWRYWITTPDSLLDGVRQFVAAAQAGGLPRDWAEKPAEDGAGGGHTLCSFSLTMDGARALGAEQEAMMELSDLPENLYFFQAVASIDGFRGVEKQSRQPTTLDPSLYTPSDLFQTNHSDAASARAAGFTESDVLSVAGLVLT